MLHDGVDRRSNHANEVERMVRARALMLVARVWERTRALDQDPNRSAARAASDSPDVATWLRPRAGRGIAS
jgi:hypothetical protein